MCTIWHRSAEPPPPPPPPICEPLGTNSQRPPKVVHHLAHIHRDLRKLRTTWHIFADASENCAPLGAYSQRPPKVMDHFIINYIIFPNLTAVITLAFMSSAIQYNFRVFYVSGLLIHVFSIIASMISNY